jgi:hypothetical protein
MNKLDLMKFLRRDEHLGNELACYLERCTDSAALCASGLEPGWPFSRAFRRAFRKLSEDSDSAPPKKERKRKLPPEAQSKKSPSKLSEFFFTAYPVRSASQKMDASVTRQFQKAAQGLGARIRGPSGGIMEKLWFTLSSLALAVAAFLALSCGASHPMNQGPINPPGLQSITLNPVTADAQDYPGGQVPFTATGHYINPSHTVTPQPALWGACQQSAPTSDISITSKGLAQCASGAAGTYTVFAFVSTNCNVIDACGGGCTIVGTAQLTCP